MGKYLLQSQTPEEPSVLLVCVLGIAVVFVGLALLVGIVTLTNTFFRKKNSNEMVKTTLEAPVTQPNPVVSNTMPIENKQELIAAICAAIAEENGTDISALRVISFKKL